MFSLNNNAPKSAAKGRRSSLSHIVDAFFSSFWIDNNPETMSPSLSSSSSSSSSSSASLSASSSLSSSPSVMETEYVSFPDFEEYPTFGSSARELKGKQSYASLRSCSSSSRDEAYYSSSSYCEDNCELEMEDYDSIRMLL